MDAEHHRAIHIPALAAEPGMLAGSHYWHAWLRNASARHARYCHPLQHAYTPPITGTALDELRTRLDADNDRHVPTHEYNGPIPAEVPHAAGG